MCRQILDFLESARPSLLSPTFSSLEFGTTFPQQYGAFYSAQLSNFCTTLFTFVACLNLSNFVPFFLVVCICSAFRLSHHSNLAHPCCHISRNWIPLLSQRAIKHSDDTHTNKICCGSPWAAHERNWITTRWSSIMFRLFRLPRTKRTHSCVFSSGW